MWIHRQWQWQESFIKVPMGTSIASLIPDDGKWWCPPSRSDCGLYVRINPFHQRRVVLDLASVYPTTNLHGSIKKSTYGTEQCAFDSWWWEMNYVLLCKRWLSWAQTAISVHWSGWAGVIASLSCEASLYHAVKSSWVLQFHWLFAVSSFLVDTWCEWKVGMFSICCHIEGI